MGSLGAAVTLMTWTWIIILIRAEIDADIERTFKLDRSVFPGTLSRGGRHGREAQPQ
jgi:hypothetical protein